VSPALANWHHRWGYMLPRHALDELAEVLTAAADHNPGPVDPRKQSSEARVQSLVRLEAAQAGVWLTRNNVGVLQDANGRPVRYGLANESKQQNSVIKSGDLIGWRRRVIVQRDVGHTIAQFVSRECKHEGWKPNPNDKHEMAQRAWANLVNINGGDAAFASGPGSFNYTE
jgi:hypothetical protein